MTLSGAIPTEQTVADGVLATFNYGFQIDQAADLRVWQDTTAISTSLLSITGVGAVSGGTFTFGTPPVLNTLITRSRVAPFGQATSYFEGDAFLSQDHEQSVDALAQQITQLQEQIQRIPILHPTILTALRSLTFPTGDNQVIGWNVGGTALTLFPSVVTQVTIDPVSGEVSGKTETTLTFTAATQVETAAAFLPTGVKVKNVTSKVLTTIGGAGAISIGGMGLQDGWGAGIAVTAGTLSTVPNRSDDPFTLSAQNVDVRSDSGDFDGSGSLFLRGHWSIYSPE